MKKTIFFIILFLLIISPVKGKELISENTNYYIKVNDEIINVKKVYDKDTLDVVFNVDFKNYNIDNNYKINDKFEFKNKNNSYYENFLYTIIYYCYLENPNDLNYYYTQVMLWQYVSEIKLKMTNKLGEELDDLKVDYNNLMVKVMQHKAKPQFANYEVNNEIWTTNTFNYKDREIVLDNPVVEELDMNISDKTLTIYNKKVGNYKLELTKDFEQEVYCYEKNDKPIYCRSLKGPNDIKFIFNYNVYGIKLKIEEKLIGINNKIGDAYLDSTYEIYLDNELKLTTKINDDIFVKSNSNYILKDVSNNISTNNLENVNFNVENEEYILKLEKSVICKNISVSINSDNKYYIYLKSNNELYEVIDKYTDLVTLPYGIYYITDNKDYYKEMFVLDDRDDILLIGEKLKENVSDKIENDITKEEIIIDNIENPQTGDFIYYYIIFNTLLVLIILVLYLFVKYVNKD